jgi:hypothetical protein
MVKEELTSQEKFFEKSVITERFIKKYKNLLITGAVVIVVGIAANIVYNVNKASTITSANQALFALEADYLDTKALADLKSLSPALYDVYIYSKAIADKDVAALETLKNSKTLLLSDLVSYELAQNNKNDLTSYALGQDAIYKDLAQVQAAILLFNEGKVSKAHSKLQTILDSSPLAEVAKKLLHYGVQ